jgi:hypothetical protein
MSGDGIEAVPVQVRMLKAITGVAEVGGQDKIRPKGQ